MKWITAKKWITNDEFVNIFRYGISIFVCLRVFIFRAIKLEWIDGYIISWADELGLIYSLE